MKKFISLIVFIAFISVSACVAQRNCSPNRGNQRHFMQVKIDKVDNTNSDGVSRVSCSLVGIPHTSSRVDSVVATVGGKRLKSNDIDGIDFGRYFQWEDEGVIPVDVDIKKVRIFNNGDSLRFYTVYGVFAAPFKATQASPKKKNR